jgi:hypothetical protein
LYWVLDALEEPGAREGPEPLVEGLCIQGRNFDSDYLTRRLAHDLLRHAAQMPEPVPEKYFDIASDAKDDGVLFITPLRSIKSELTKLKRG